jgi:hypothetical protein
MRVSFVCHFLIVCPGHLALVSDLPWICYHHLFFAVMVRSNYPDAERLKVALRNISMDPTFRGMVFSGTANPSNHLFKCVLPPALCCLLSQSGAKL